MSEDYPITPPSIIFITKIFHQAEWSPAWNLSSACRAIIALLAEPAADSPLNCDAGNMIRANDLRAFRYDIVICYKILMCACDSRSMATMYATEYAERV